MSCCRRASVCVCVRLCRSPSWSMNRHSFVAICYAQKLHRRNHMPLLVCSIIRSRAPRAESKRDLVFLSHGRGQIRFLKMHSREHFQFIVRSSIYYSDYFIFVIVLIVRASCKCSLWRRTQNHIFPLRPKRRSVVRLHYGIFVSELPDISRNRKTGEVYTWRGHNENVCPTIIKNYLNAYTKLSHKVAAK